MKIILTSLVAFVSTNIDDIFVLMLFLGDKRRSIKSIVIGQYFGISVLILISLAGSLAGLLIDEAYIGLLGLLPIYFGIRALFSKEQENEEEPVVAASQAKGHAASAFSVAAVTMANGGDNIGIYIPLYANLSATEKGIMTAIFLIMVGVWCRLAIYLRKHPLIARPIERSGHIITPVVLILLGIYILYESNTFGLLNGVW